jgi:hypothetical protein
MHRLRVIASKISNRAGSSAALSCGHAAMRLN